MGLWREVKTAGGRPYYYHIETKETRWDKPEGFDDVATPATPAADPAAVDAAWNEAKASDGRTYYYNSVTRVTQWNAPEAYLRHKQNAQPSIVTSFVAGAGQSFGKDEGAPSDRRMGRRDDREHHLPQKPTFDGGRGGSMVPWERPQDNQSGFRGAMPTRIEEPEYPTQELAEEAFFAVLKKHHIAPDTPWIEALRLVIRERDYRAIKDPKDRKQAFEKYCNTIRAEYKEREKARKERLKEDFRKMLGTHDEIVHYTRWKTARPFIEREAVFKQASNDIERRAMFEEYILELKKRHAEDEKDKRETAVQQLGGLLRILVTDPDTKWRDAHEAIKSNPRFTSDPVFSGMPDIAILNAFESHIKDLEVKRNAAKQKEKRMEGRRARQARDAFKQLLSEKLSEGKINARSKWQNFFPLIDGDERYTNLIGQPGSSPLDLFWDIVEVEQNKLRSKRSVVLDVLEDRQWEMTVNTTYEDFRDFVATDDRTASISADDMQMIYENLMTKVQRRNEEEKKEAEEQRKRQIDALRSVIKRLEPPVRLGDTFEDILPRIAALPEYRELDDDEARRSAFEKHMRRLKEKEEDNERERARRERDREHRNGSRRERDDRHRRHRTRTPEVDAYEADRRKAQADRERQYRKASFGLTPPPRDRRDDRDRYDDRRRHERVESIYDRERREREMERERNYISRADPRDKGRALDYGDEDGGSSRPGSIRKRRESDVSTRDSKRARPARTRSRDSHPEAMLKEEPPALQSGSEEGEIEEI